MVKKKHEKKGKNGFLISNLVKERVRSYSLSDLTKKNGKRIVSKIKTV